MTVFYDYNNGNLLAQFANQVRKALKLSYSPSLYDR